MKSADNSSTYKKYRDAQVAWASAEDLLLIMANELIRLKEETGMNLFWDDSEEKLIRDYIERSEALAQS